ncbi:MAG: putative dehydrogenase related to phosphoglycerate dehydrogenase [Paenibacillus sp.]|jgi:D-3-phosphoglycerate dehydrogenase|nr:putative dehydrogenase related to phosphoglycerate dehydrogenase [Paenibacillus sp.]
MKKIVYIQPVHEGGMNRLAGKYEVIVAPDTSRETIERLIADADAIVTRLTPIDRDLIAKGAKLKAIARHGIGVDNIDVEFAASRNVAVITTGNANSLSVAEHAFFAIGSLFKKIPFLDRQVRKGNWASRDKTGATEITGKCIGIVGLGNVGSQLARMAKYGMNMQVLIYDPFASVEAVQANGYEKLDDLDELLKRADVVSVHVPLIADTKNLIDDRRFRLMKPGSFIINFARGGIIDEQALYRALTEGHLAGAALDVYEQEPPDVGNPLYQLNNIILSPHCSYFTEESRVKMSMHLAEKIEEALEGHTIDEHR